MLLGLQCPRVHKSASSPYISRPVAERLLSGLAYQGLLNILGQLVRTNLRPIDCPLRTTGLKQRSG
jgi:hypothetical protein